MRISGTCASLAGLEKALQEETEREVELALRRILLIYSVILSLGGIPLIYLGDEIATLNDYSYQSDPARANDSRWVHRQPADPNRVARRLDPATLEGSLFSRLLHLIHLRQAHPVFGVGETIFLEASSPHVLMYARSSAGQVSVTDSPPASPEAAPPAHRLLILANFAEMEQTISANELRLAGIVAPATDLVSQKQILPGQDLVLAPLQFCWFI
jgi:amylosucrase